MTFEVAFVTVVGLLVLGYVTTTAIERIWPKESGMDPIEAIDRELQRLHSELKDYVGGTQDSESYKAVLGQVAKLNQALFDLEMENTKAFNTVQINESTAALRSSQAMQEM